MEKQEFQTKVLGGVEAIQTEHKALAKRFEPVEKSVVEVTGEVKKAFEELAKVQKQLNSVAEVETQLKKVSLAMAQQKREIHGNPIRRIQANEELRLRLNLAVRRAVGSDGALKSQCEVLAKAIGEDTGYGSNLITPALADEIYDTLAMYGRWNTLGVRRVGTKITKFPVKTARSQANWILTESNAIADDTAKAGSTVSLTVEVIAALLNISKSLLEDTTFDVTADTLDDFSEAFNQQLDLAAFVGDGSATYGNNTGIFTGGVQVPAAATHTAVGKMTYDDFIATLLGVDPVVLSRASKWWAHPQMLARIVGIKDLNGRPIFQNALEAPSAGAIGTLLGFPVELVLAAPNTDGLSKPVIAFGDPNGCVVGVRQDFVFEASDDFRWNTLERSFRGYGRAGVALRRSQAFGVLVTAAA